MPRATKEWIGKTHDSMPGKIVRLRILVRQGDACADCRKPIVAGSNPACDHIKPLADGGKNVEGNLQILCGLCHGAKTSAENTQRATERSRKAKNIGFRKEPSRSFRRPPGTHYDWSRGGRLVKDEAR